jgi:NAD(P)-dependent dehydrogenase (short-subunit alcohol dehydrogenase family)
MNAAGKLSGKKALVTGSGTGIGRAIASEFAREGADVVLHYGRSRTGAISAVEEIGKMGRRATAFPADFTKVEEAVALAEKAMDFLGGIDCLVNNAGITMNMPFATTTVEQFDTLLSVNLRAPYFLTQRVVKQMIEQGGGNVCNVTSIHGIQGAPQHSAYAATKGAIIGYTRALAMELAHKGIRFNAIAPGMIVVENYFHALPGFSEEAAAEMAQKIPISRAGRPLDIARLAVFLCSEESEFIVGQTLIADGGTTSLMSLISDFRTDFEAHFGRGYVAGV